MKTLANEDLAWAGGFFEGEGCFSHCKGGRNTKSQVIACIAQVNREALERFKDSVFSIGKIVGPVNPKKNNHSSYYRWYVHGYEGVQAIVAMLWPFLTDKRREQAARVLTEFRKDRIGKAPYWRPMRRYA